MWLVINVQIYSVLRAFHLDLPFSSSFVVTAAAVLGLAVPTPGGLGSYHVAVQLALTDLYAVPRDTASGVALLAHAISFVPITLLGITLFALTRCVFRESEELAEDRRTGEDSDACSGVRRFAPYSWSA